MLSPKHALVNCITLLCLEHRKGVATSPSNDLIKEVIATLPIPEGSVDTDHGRQTFLDLRKLTQSLLNHGKDDFPSDIEIIQHVQVAVREETYLYDALAGCLQRELPDITSVVKLIQSYRGGLHKHINEHLIEKIVKEYTHKLIFKKDGGGDAVSLIREMGEKLEPYIKARSDNHHPALMSAVDFGNPDEVKEQFEAVKILLSPEGALRSGWKALNRMWGKLGAIKLGEFVTAAGLQHNFKSGFMLSLLVHFCLFNKPYLRDKTRKPLILFVTFENETPDNILWIYKYLKENETGIEVVESEIDIDEASTYVGARLREAGFEVMMRRYDPTEFTASAFTEFLDSLYAEGYEIKALLIDYLNMLPKTGLDAKTAGEDIRLLFRRVRNYTSPRGIACITPHQLSTEANELIRNGVEDFVKVIANKNYYDGCRRLGQEPDLEMFIHIEIVDGKKYLTISRGKHRNTVTDVKDQYCVLPFQPVGTIPWDIDKDYEIAVAMPGGGAIGSGEEEPWWANAA